MTRAGYAEVVQVLVEQLWQPSAGGGGAVVDQMLPFVADLKSDLVKMAVEGVQQGKAVDTQWLLKKTLMSQFHLYASMVDHNQGASLEVLTAMLLSKSPAVVEVAVEACAGVLVGEEVLPPHQDFLAVYPLELRKASGDMQLDVSLLLLKNSSNHCVVRQLTRSMKINYVCMTRRLTVTRIQHLWSLGSAQLT